MAGKGSLDVEVTSAHRFEARVKHMEDATLLFVMMGLLEPLKCLDEEFALKARIAFAEVLARWVPDEIAEAGAGIMVGEPDAEAVFPDDDDVEIENFAYLLAVRDTFPGELREVLASMEDDEGEES